MRIAVPEWEGMISPVLDTANRLLVVDTRDGAVVSKQVIHIGGMNWIEKARNIRQYTEVLICGALSQSLEKYLLSIGIVLYPWVMGDAEKIVEQYAGGTVPGPECMMPGCRQHRRGRNARVEEYRNKRGPAHSVARRLKNCE